MLKSKGKCAKMHIVDSFQTLYISNTRQRSTRGHGLHHSGGSRISTIKHADVLAVLSKTKDAEQDSRSWKEI